VRTKDSGTNHVRVNLWLTIYKLTGRLASLDSLDLAAPTQRLILSHQTASSHALYDVLGLDGGRGKTMSLGDLVDSDRELPVNLAIRTDTSMRTYTQVQNKTKQSKRIGDLTPY